MSDRAMLGSPEAQDLFLSASTLRNLGLPTVEFIESFDVCETSYCTSPDFVTDTVTLWHVYAVLLQQTSPLSERQKTILISCFVNDRPMAEVANVLGISVAAVSKNVDQIIIIATRYFNTPH